MLLLRPTIARLQRAGHAVTLMAPAGPASAIVGSGPADVRAVLDWDSAAFAGLHAENGLAPGPAADSIRAHDAAIAYTRSATLARSLTRLIPNAAGLDPEPPEGRHASEWLASALPRLGVPVAPIDVPDLQPGEADRRRAEEIAAPLPAGFAALHPGSGSPSKNWPADRFAALARSLAPEGWLLVRGPADDDAAAVVGRVPGAVIARDLPPRTLAALLARAGVFVGNDSGVTHLAAATGAPTIALFGPTDPRTWAPVGPRVTVLAAGRTTEGIAVDAVRAAVAAARR